MMIIFLILGAVALYYAAKYFGWIKNGHGVREPSSLEILKERYVKGEINREKYEEMKRIILEEEKIYE